MSKVYLSGPITGLTYWQARYKWRKTFAEMLEGLGGGHIVLLSPMRHEGHLAEMKSPIGPETLPSHLFSHPKLIVAKDFLDIEESTLVVVNFLGSTVVSQGTLIEMGYAKRAGKQIIVISDDTDPHNSPFIKELGIVVRTLEEAAAIVASLLSEGL
jgi:nucleoside 2-deoxyribosyltransferase